MPDPTDPVTPVDVNVVGGPRIEARIRADGFRIRYWRAGAGAPLIVLHNAAGPRPELVLEAFSRDFDVVAFELPGFGDTPNDRTANVAELAHTMLIAVGALGWGTYHLMGTSLGGFIAVEMALAAPKRVRSMVLESPMSLRDGYRPLAGLSPEEFRAAFRSQPDREPVWSPPDPATFAPRAALLGRLLGPPIDDAAMERRLATCPVRTLVVFGRDEGVVPVHNGATYERVMPDATFVCLNDAAHDVHADRGKDFERLVIDFLKDRRPLPLPAGASLGSAAA